LSHSVAVWRAIISMLNGPLELAPGQGIDDLPEDGADPAGEIMRRYPGLSRAVAEYLARSSGDR
jgi:hypothetical protein